MTATLADTHGTEADYQKGCHCTRCRKAHAAYNAGQRRSPRDRVPAGKVRTHILDLQCHAPAGPAMSLREIANAAGVNRETVRVIASGEAVYCAARVRSKILGVLPPPRQGKHISVTTDVEFDDPAPSFDDPLASLRLLLTGRDDLAWKAEAECARLEIPVDKRQRWFFPMRGEQPVEAKSVCSRCPVWAACLQFSLDWNMEGIWGRSAGSDRRKLVRYEITVDELVAVGMDTEHLSMGDAIGRVLDARQAVA